MHIEIIATTPKDARRIETCGANRIELVSALSEGGLTPSYGMIEAVISSVSIPVNVMIRPHTKSFYYTQEELDIMKRDIDIARNLRANGVVFGALTKDHTVCEPSLQQLLPCCIGLDVTFHRAIDETDPLESIHVLAKYPQITSVLTSGGKGRLLDNLAILKEMQKNCGQIRLMVGGGLTSDNVRIIQREINALQYHFGTAARAALSDEIDTARLRTLVRRMAEEK